VEAAIERLVALLCFVFGVSHIVQPCTWVELFVSWRDKGKLGVFYIGLLQLPIGAFIVAFHNVWTGMPLLVTLLGWGWTLKGALYLCYPEHGLRMMKVVSVERSWHFVIAGLILVAFAALISYSLAMRDEL
jgi:hypothetical protein